MFSPLSQILEKKLENLEQIEKRKSRQIKGSWIENSITTLRKLPFCNRKLQLVTLTKKCYAIVGRIN